MSDAEEQIRKGIHARVWSGFYDGQDVIDMIDLDQDAGIDRDAMVATVRNEFRRKAVAEASWPETTDPDRLNEVFAALNSQGICALQNAGWDQADGYRQVQLASARGGYQGYCFFHGQDLESVLNGQGLFLAFGSLDASGDGVEVGKAIRRALVDRGFAVEWDETTRMRILIPNIDWKRRRS